LSKEVSRGLRCKI